MWSAPYTRSFSAVRDQDNTGGSSCGSLPATRTVGVVLVPRRPLFGAPRRVVLFVARGGHELRRQRDDRAHLLRAERAHAEKGEHLAEEGCGLPKRVSPHLHEGRGQAGQQARQRALSPWVELQLTLAQPVAPCAVPAARVALVYGTGLLAHAAVIGLAHAILGAPHELR
eukprot:scaffold10067_cov67-Phaeocystis_antarctica.AAC.12